MFSRIHRQVCFLPLMLVNVADDGVEFPFLHILASVLAWASAVINPFIYAFKNRQYQQAFAKVINLEIKHALPSSTRLQPRPNSPTNSPTSPTQSHPLSRLQRANPTHTSA